MAQNVNVNGSEFHTNNSPTATTINIPESVVTAEQFSRADLQASHERLITQTETKTLEEFPVGYPRLAAFNASEQSFSIYRSFKYLHSRVILELQHELCCLERRLAQLDAIQEQNDEGKRLKSIAFDQYQARGEQGGSSERAKLVATIRGKLVEYDEILAKTRESNTFQQPSDRDYRSVRTYFLNERPLASEQEESYIKQKEDIISLRHGRERSFVHGLMEDAIRRTRWRFIHSLFCTTELQSKTSGDLVVYSSTRRVDRLAAFLTTIVMLLLVILPVIALYKFENSENSTLTLNSVGIFIGFAFLFVVAMLGLMKVNRHELLAALAVYCAVLAAFITN